MAQLDPRLNAFRPDVADARLKGAVDAPRFVTGEKRRVVMDLAPLKHAPAADASLASEVLRGEEFTVFDENEEGWAWGQLQTDGYVGYVPAAALGPVEPRPTHRVSALRTFIYAGPDLKLPPQGLVSLGSRLAIDHAAETRGVTYLLLAGGGGAVVAQDIEPSDAPPAADFVAVAERFVGTAYLWGGRTSIGLDCSALVQLALAACGKACPRDSDLQEAALGAPVEGGIAAPLQRGDLVFWRGHVGMMIDGEYMIHATTHQMAVTIEPLAAATERNAEMAGAVTSVRRI